MLVPVAALFAIAAGPGDGTWQHLAGTVLPRSLRTTLILMAGVAAGTATIGVTTAWLTASCRFPGRRLLQVALVLPLAVPTYIIAFAYIEVLDFTGPLQRVIRALGGYRSVRQYWSPDIKSLPGAIYALTVVLYPYVYLTCRVLFLRQTGATLQVARTLGAGPVKMFFRVAVPLARPAIAIGVTLCLMETLNDIGAISFLGVRTLTFSVYDTWLNRGSLSGAAQIACVMLVFVLALIAAERFARGRQRYHAPSGASEPPPHYRLTGIRAAGAVAACALPPLLGFVVPAWTLVALASRRLERFASAAVVDAAMNSIAVASVTAAVAVTAGLFLAYAVRMTRRRPVAALVRLASVGYAVPGTVLAVGILIPLAAFDNLVDGWMQTMFGISTGLMLTGSGAAIVYACTVRFLAISIGTLEAGLQKISEHLDMAARTLGRTPAGMVAEVHLPLMRPAIVTAALLVFVDTLKELPATLLLRPFNFDTLATFTYSQASRAAYGEAAVPALTIVLVGMIPVILLLRGDVGAGLRREAGGPV